jgi:hypothetical protein
MNDLTMSDPIRVLPRVRPRTFPAVSVAGVIGGALAGWLIYRAASRRPEQGRVAGAREELRENARKALAMKQADPLVSERPASRRAHEGMRPLPNGGIAPSGAFTQEGHRPVLERSRKVR